MISKGNNFQLDEIEEETPDHIVQAKLFGIKENRPDLKIKAKRVEFVYDFPEFDSKIEIVFNAFNRLSLLYHQPMGERTTVIGTNYKTLNDAKRRAIRHMRETLGYSDLSTLRNGIPTPLWLEQYRRN